MNFEELSQKLTEIGTCEDDSSRRVMITEVSDAVKGIFEQNDSLTKQNETLTADKKKLQEDNMELFLRVGGQKKADEQDPKPADEKLTYEALFDDQGELK